MKQPTVKFFLTDGLKPNKISSPSHSPTLVALLAPFLINLEAEKAFTLDFGLTCSHPLLFVPSSKVETVTAGIIMTAGSPVRVTLRAKITAQIEQGEPLLLALPLGLQPFEIE